MWCTSSAHMGIIERSGHNPFSFGPTGGGDDAGGPGAFDQQSLFETLINSPMVGSQNLAG